MNKDNFLKLTLNVETDKVEAFEDYIWQIGALSLSLLESKDSKPIFEPPPGEVILWQEKFTAIEVLFPIHSDREIIESMILHASEDFLCNNLKFEILGAQLWERLWLKDYKSIHFGDRFSIFPTHMIPNPPPKHPFIIMDPGLAFGTGTHPTTYLCLNYLSQAKLDKKSLLDFGCGSGILGISAKKMGAEKIALIDHDPQAIQASKQNAYRNSANSGISYYLPNQMPDSETFDFVIANIFSQVLIDLCDGLKNRLNPDGVILLSGVLNEQFQEMSKRYEESNLELKKIDEKDDWLLLEGKSKKIQQLI